MEISIIVAASDNNVIGKDNQLLWHLPKDMRYFKNTTWGLPIIMGRKTYESFGSKSLPGRPNIILSTQSNLQYEGAIVLDSLDAALRWSTENDYKEVMIIGGGQIYEMAMSIATTIYMTRVHATIEGDTFFPSIDTSKWQLKHTISHEKDEKHAYAFDFETWKRK
jgi:dihydrofolate reductase